jgi:hypothetical protein
MRAEAIPESYAIANHTLLDYTLENGIGPLRTAFDRQALCDFGPTFLCGRGRDIRFKSLARMLQALKTATESYLEVSISTVGVAFPFPISGFSLKRLHSAGSSVSLQISTSERPAGFYAARASIWDSEYSCDDPQLVLTVEHTHAALTALLVYENCGYYEDRRVLHDTHLGADGLSGGSDGSHRDLVRALRDLTDLPLKDGNGEGLTHIGRVILLGESAADPRLNVALKDVLGEQFGRLVPTAVDERAGVIDPLYVASRGVAQYCWDQQPQEGCIIDLTHPKG